MVSDVVEDYLKTIYTIQRECGSPVGTTAIADALDVKPPTVSSMLSTLAEEGLVERQKYAGVELTPAGERIALEVIRHHRLIETFLLRHLDYGWSEVHDEADVLEHHISESFERRLASALDDPVEDPHGDPIPDADLSAPSLPGADPLTDFEAGETVEVVRVSDRNRRVLEHFESVGIRPGITLRIEDDASIGMYTLVVEDETVQLPESIADLTMVRPTNASNRDLEVTDA
ncbi:MAG: metal-dependent transcriptional regulator [Halanaeroarchaeum sp.]